MGLLSGGLLVNPSSKGLPTSIWWGAGQDEQLPTGELPASAEVSTNGIKGFKGVSRR